MKTTIQIKTGEFEYIMQEFESGLEPDKAVEAYNNLKDAYTPQRGISVKDFNEWLDKYLLTQTGSVDEYNSMSPEQKSTIQIIKRSLARIKNKQE